MNHDGASQRPMNRLCFLSPPLCQDSSVHVCELPIFLLSFSGKPSKAPALKIRSASALSDWGQSRFSSHQILFISLFFRGVIVCSSTMQRDIAFLQHLPLALILCSGTSYLLCMFACTSAFDGLLGLILAMQSLSPFSLVLVYVKPEEGRHQRWRMAIEKRSKCCRIIGGMRDFDCTVCCFMFCAV